jgi:hypothetical protein
VLPYVNGIHTLDKRETVGAIAERFGQPRWKVQERARLEGWPRRTARRRAPARGLSSAGIVAIRRRLIRRLFRILEAQSVLMEKRMQKYLKDPAAAAKMPAVERERDARAVGTFVRNIDKATEIAADLDRTTDGRGESTNDDELFAEADRFRRELAERLSKFIPASS